jgi:hypothetical protein
MGADYEIYYFAPSATFDQVYATDFQALLQLNLTPVTYQVQDVLLPP